MLGNLDHLLPGNHRIVDCLGIPADRLETAFEPEGVAICLSIQEAIFPMAQSKFSIRDTSFHLEAAAHH